MDWTDLKRFDSFIWKIKALGAHIEEIGASSEGRALYGITVGNTHAARTVVIVAGCHADEIIGPLAAVSIIQGLVQKPISEVRFGIVPVADPDFLHRNANDLPTNVTLRDLLNLRHQRDLEGYFTLDTYPECIAIRQWIKQFDQIDAYLSLHSAHLITPGLFFYVGSVSDPFCVKQVASRITTVLPDYIPLLSHDPTGLAQAVLSPGFFELAIPDVKEMNQRNPGSSLAFVAHQFQPQFVGASEIPLAVCPALNNASLSKIDQCNRDFKQTGHINYPFQEISLDIQLSIMQTWIRSVAQCVAAT